MADRGGDEDAAGGGERLHLVAAVVGEGEGMGVVAVEGSGVAEGCHMVLWGVDH